MMMNSNQIIKKLNKPKILKVMRSIIQMINNQQIFNRGIINRSMSNIIQKMTTKDIKVSLININKKITILTITKEMIKEIGTITKSLNIKTLNIIHINNKKEFYTFIN